MKGKKSRPLVLSAPKADATPVTQSITVQAAGGPSEGSHTVDVLSGAVLEGAVVGEDGTIQLSMEECLQQGITVDGPDGQETMLIIKTQPVDSTNTE